MVTKVVMPRLSLTMKEGTVVQWFKKEGDTVNKGEPLVEVLSEKVTYDIEAPESGVLRRISVSEGLNVPVDQTIGVIAGADEPVSEEETVPSEKPPVKETAEVVHTQAPSKAAERVPASPAAKRLAKELRVDLAKVSGTGLEGRIIEDDVKRFAEATTTIKPRVRETFALSGIRKTTAERLALSARTAPHSTVIMEVNMGKAVKLRQEMQLSYTEILVKAVAKALREHPLLNATLEGDRIVVFEDINIGVAVATEDGLVVPVIRNADQKSLDEITLTLKGLLEKAREGKLTREDLVGGTFTVTNLGMYGVDVFIPIINPPETAILGVGRVVEKPAVINGELTTKPVMQISLTYDHRIVDGAPAAQFLMTVKRILEDELSQKF